MFLTLRGVLTKLFDRASKRDISFLIRVIAISVFIVAVGLAVCLVLRGTVEVDVEAKPTPSAK